MIKMLLLETLARILILDSHELMSPTDKIVTFDSRVERLVNCRLCGDRDKVGGR